MKKLIYSLSIFMLLTASCKNDDPEPDAKRQTIYDTTKVIQKFTDSIFHHFYDTTKLTMYDTVRVPIISDHSWIIYLHNNGTDDVDTVDIKNGTYTNIKSDLTRFGYDLVKWSTSPNGGGREYTPGDSYYVSQDITLYAIWQSHDGLHDYEVYDFLAKQAEGSTVDVKIIDLNPDFDKIKTALDKFWRVKVHLNLEDAIGVSYFSSLIGCTNILSIKFPSTIKLIGDDCLNHSGGLYNVEWNGSSGIIGMKGLTSLILPTGLECLSISTCENLSTIEVPNTVKFLSIHDCPQIKEIVIPNDILTISLNGLSVSILNLPNGLKTIGGISNNPNLTEINIPESVESINMSFGGCTNLKIVKHNLKECSRVNFYGCKSLTSILLPEFRPENPGIDANAFYGCSSLTSITIPESVTIICNSVFEGCSSLTSLKLESTTPPALPDGWIQYSGTIYVPSSAVNTYKTADVWKDHADQIVGY